MLKCIYCNKSESDGIVINDSHIIPDALINNKNLTYHNVCSIDHNRKFAEEFEDEIIQKCGRIRNYYNIKNKKHKVQSFKTQININGYTYTGKFSYDDNGLLGGSKFPVTKDGTKYLFGMINESDVKTQKPYELITDFHFSENLQFEEMILMLHSRSMLRLVAKIGYEWFCKCNEINGFSPTYSDIVEYITNKNCDLDVVSVIDNEELLNKINDEIGIGAHTLAIYNTSLDQNTYVIYSFFGLVLYKTKICHNLIPIFKPINKVEYYGIRSDGTILPPMITYANDFDKFFASFKPDNEIASQKERILQIYKSMFSHQIVTLRSIYPYVQKISAKLALIKVDVSKTKEYIGTLHDNVITIVYLLYYLGRHREEYDFDKSFDENIKIIFNESSKIVVSKNVRESLTLSTSYPELIQSLDSGISVFNDAYNKEYQRKFYTRNAGE